MHILLEECSESEKEKGRNRGSKNDSVPFFFPCAYGALRELLNLSKDLYTAGGVILSPQQPTPAKTPLAQAPALADAILLRPTTFRDPRLARHVDQHTTLEASSPNSLLVLGLSSIRTTHLIGSSSSSAEQCLASAASP